MKKLMALLAIFSLIVPFVNVNAVNITNCAASNSCFVYTPGMEVNFYRNEAESQSGSTNAGISTVILSDGGSGEQYVKTMALTSFGGTPYYGELHSQPMVQAIADFKSYLTLTQTYQWESARHTGNDLDMTLISKDEMINIFGATSTDGNTTYTIDATKWGDVFSKAAAYGLSSYKGFFTSDYDLASGKVWAVEWSFDSEHNVEKLTLKQVNMMSNVDYAYLPVVYFDKTYDCSGGVNGQMACYSCEGEGYRWLQVGTQAKTCTLIPEKTTKSSCATSIQTGVEDYLLEFIGIALICGVALVIAKKKDLFRAI